MRTSVTGVHVQRHGRMIVVTGHATGASRIVVRVVRGQRTVASARATVRRGAFRVRLRAPRSVRVVVAAGAVKRTVKVR